ncbi:hypothetical protein K402DRAFT_392648 [Aulographum hederae CBS 113979]|uniref:Uncharacterized protein n=1 Tax=Aulographum hederae CBS 113979 TaxID=1176131 RepID=A0A6G1H2D3_9PEZI|nr:hypothetical protein K402DRAFT_392648 [Aulographum hederae CBS 113979]
MPSWRNSLNRLESDMLAQEDYHNSKVGARNYRTCYILRKRHVSAVNCNIALSNVQFLRNEDAIVKSTYTKTKTNASPPPNSDKQTDKKTNKKRLQNSKTPKLQNSKPQILSLNFNFFKFPSLTESLSYARYGCDRAGEWAWGYLLSSAWS